MTKPIEVFTPASPAKITFVERKSVNNQIVNALKTPGKQIVIYGHSGCGKTTLLLNKLDQTYENQIIIRCVSDTKFEDIIAQAFDDLGATYDDSSKATAITATALKLSSDYKAIKAEMNITKQDSTEITKKRILSPKLTIQNLARFLGGSNCCLVLEDFHKVLPDEKVKISQSMKLFMDMSVDYPTLRSICIGAVDSGREVVEYDPELRNRISEIKVPLMTDDEIREIMKIGFKALELNVPGYVIDRVVKLSNGVPSICHSICLHMCFVKKIGEIDEISKHITEKDLEKALDGYIQDSSDSIIADFEKAVMQKKKKYKNAELIFQALSKLNIEGAEYNEIFSKIHEVEPAYPAGNLSTYLHKLTESEFGSTIIKSGNKIRFKSPMYHTFADCLYNKAHVAKTTISSIKLDLDAIREKLEYLSKNNAPNNRLPPAP